MPEMRDAKGTGPRHAHPRAATRRARAAWLRAVLGHTPATPPARDRHLGQGAGPQCGLVGLVIWVELDISNNHLDVSLGVFGLEWARIKIQ